MDIKSALNNIASNRTNESVKTPSKEVSDKDSTQTASTNLDKVTLTQAFSQVSNLEHKARSVNIDNSARIEELKSAIQDGSYKADPERIAEKLMQTEALFYKF